MKAQTFIRWDKQLETLMHTFKVINRYILNYADIYYLVNNHLTHTTNILKHSTFHNHKLTAKLKGTHDPEM